jgi:hypothetical protein
MSSTSSTLLNCPTCGEAWTKLRERSDPWDSDIKDFLRKMQFLRRVEGNFGCALGLEIKEEDEHV